MTDPSTTTLLLLMLAGLAAGICEWGIQIARIPAAWLPCTSSNSRSPTYTASSGRTPTASAAARNASACGLVQAISLE